jgi:hypothetical protein
MAWVPDKVELELRDIDGKLTHTTLGAEVPTAALQIAQDLDRLGADKDITARAARQLLKDNNVRAASDMLRAALRHRKETADKSRIHVWVESVESGTPSGTPPADDGTEISGTQTGTTDETASRRGGTRSARSGTPDRGVVPDVPRSLERHAHDTPPPDRLADWL